MRWKALAAVGLLVIGAGAVLWAITGGPGAASSDGTQYLTSEATQGDVADTVVATGSLSRGATYALAFGQAATKIADGATDGPGGSGTWDVTDVAVSVGDTVTKDQVLAAADTASLRRDLAVAVADLNAAKTQRKVADTQLDDANTTAAKRQARIGRYNAMAQVTSAQSKVDDLRDQIARAKIIAPADGIVTSLDVSAGTTAPSTSAMTIDTGPIKATADVAEGDLPALAIGQPATVVVGAIDATLQGTVSSVAPAASSNSGGSVVTYAVVVDLTDVPADARPGMTADVTVVTEAGQRRHRRARRGAPGDAGQLPRAGHGRRRRARVPRRDRRPGDRLRGRDQERAAGRRERRRGHDGRSHPVVEQQLRVPRRWRRLPARDVPVRWRRAAGRCAMSAAPIVQLQGVHRVYHTGRVDVRALDGLDLDVQRGEFLSVVGPSGSGKSTLMNVIGCLDRPTAGRYLLDGADVGQLDDDGLAALRSRAIGFVFQSYNLLPRTTALENVATPLAYQGVRRSEREARAREALERLGLADRMDHEPTELSGGQQQRVAIARALVTEPALLLADEPTGNLDSVSGAEVMGILRDLHASGRTVVLITHDADVAQFADRQVHVRDGKLLS